MYAVLVRRGFRTVDEVTQPLALNEPAEKCGEVESFESSVWRGPVIFAIPSVAIPFAIVSADCTVFVFPAEFACFFPRSVIACFCVREAKGPQKYL